MYKKSKFTKKILPVSLEPESQSIEVIFGWKKK